MPILQAAKRVLSRYARFSGRASRAELWWWVLGWFVLIAFTRFIDASVIAPVLGFATFAPEAGQPLSVLVSLALLLPNLAVGARRLHDIGRTGWWLCIGIVPAVGALILIYFYVQPTQPGENRFGSPDPLPRA